MKRHEGELRYDYCARRLLEKYRLAILKLGLPAWVSTRKVTQKNRDTGELRVVNEVVQGTYRKSKPNERKLSKKEKKRLRKLRTASKIANLL